MLRGPQGSLFDLQGFIKEFIKPSHGASSDHDWPRPAHRRFRARTRLVDTDARSRAVKTSFSAPLKKFFKKNAKRLSTFAQKYVLRDLARLCLTCRFHVIEAKRLRGDTYVARMTRSHVRSVSLFTYLSFSSVHETLGTLIARSRDRSERVFFITAKTSKPWISYHAG